jgi:nucleoside-diphosphate-sugar epimerase
MNILILGSEGFIGRHLVHHFSAIGHTIAGCDLFETSSTGSYRYFKVFRLSPEWDDMFADNHFDLCINAAGSGNVPYSMQHPMQDFEANTLDTLRVLDAIRKHNARCRYLHISSAAVYGNPQHLPIREDAPLHPLSPYGWHKLMAEHICREYFELYNIPVAIVRPFSVYGNGLRKQLLWDVCSKLQQQNQISLFGTGNESRDFIHVEDLCALIQCVVKDGQFNATTYNAAIGEQVLISTIAGLLQTYFDKNKIILFGGEQRKGDPLNWQADMSLATQLGFVPRITLEEGVQRYVRYYKETVEAQ